MTKGLLFYAAGSCLRMANEAVAAWHTAKVAKTAKTFADAPTGNADALSEWYVGVSARVNLQAQIGWTGVQDGYVEAGKVDPARPYAVIQRDLDPNAEQQRRHRPTYPARRPHERP